MGKGTLTLTDNSIDGGGIVTSPYAGLNTATIALNGASLVVSGVKVESTFDLYGIAIKNIGAGSVTVDSGSVEAPYVAIHNNSTGKVSVRGGLIRSASRGAAIFNSSTGKIMISNDALITSANTDPSSGTIDLNAGADSDTVLVITGGTIDNTAGTAIYNRGSGMIYVSGGFPVIKGRSKAMNKAPDLNAYPDVIITASKNYDGSSQVTYDALNITSYKYLGFAPKIPVGNDQSGGGSGGSSSGDSNSDGKFTITRPVTGENGPTLVEVKVTGTVDRNGHFTLSLSDKTVIDAYVKGLEEAKKNGDEHDIVVVLRIDTGSKNGAHATITMPTLVQKAIIVKGIGNTVLVVTDLNISIGLDLKSVEEIQKQTNSDIDITVTRRDSSTMSDDVKNAIGNRPVFDLAVNYGSGKQVRNFGTGSITIEIPYNLGPNEKAENLCAVYVDDKGKVHWLTDSVYDSVKNVLRFNTDHFSLYGIGYRQNNTSFTDIEGHWAKDDIAFVVDRGLFSGTSASTFSPNTSMTRGMFVTVLGRLAGAEVSSYNKSSFNDVKQDAYYMGYIEWASKNNIVKGTGNGTFTPDQAVSREQMAVMIQNYAEVMGLSLPNAYGENLFADGAKISTYAKNAVKKMQISGILSGKTGNLFDPQGTATRAEVSAVLHRFVELADSGDTL